MATVTRVFEFDAAHRVMNERVKCFNLHGHRWRVEITLEYSSKSALGYAIDFKEIKRILGTWIDSSLDHACILNPLDTEIIEMCRKNGWRLYVMGMGNVTEDRNPSAENLASELLYVSWQLLNEGNHGVRPVRLRLYETPNCWVETQEVDYKGDSDFISRIREWKESMGTFNYDVREE